MFFCFLSIINAQNDKNNSSVTLTQEIQDIAFLIGDWDVKSELWSSSREMWSYIDNTSSSIVVVNENMIMEDNYNENTKVFLRTMEYTFDTKSKLYKLSFFNASTSKLDIFEGNFIGDVFTLKKVLDSGKDDGSPQFQITIHKSEQDTFGMEIMYSVDGGIKWCQNNRLTYTRKKG